MGKFAGLVLMLLSVPVAQAASEPAAAEPAASGPVRWDTWRAGNSVTDRGSLQRGAKDTHYLPSSASVKLCPVVTRKTSSIVACRTGTGRR